MTAKLKLSFKGRRTVSTENEYGPHLRVNVKNGNFQISKLVAEAMGLSKGDRVNFSYGDDIYIAKMPKGAPGAQVDPKINFTSKTHGVDFGNHFKEQLGENDNVVILSVDLDDPYVDENADVNGKNNEVKAYKLGYQESFSARQSRDGKEEEAETETASEELV